MKKLYFLKDPPDLTGGSVKSGVRESEMWTLAEQRRWGANAFAAMRDRELKLEQLDRARLDVHAAARVESGPGPLLYL